MATQRQGTKADTLLSIAQGFRNFQQNKRAGKLQDARIAGEELKRNLEIRRFQLQEANFKVLSKNASARLKLDREDNERLKQQQDFSQALQTTEVEERESAMARLIGGQPTSPPASQQAALEALPPGQFGPVDTGVGSPTTTSPSIQAILDANRLKVPLENIPGTVQRRGAELDIKQQQADLNKLQGETAESVDLSQFDNQKVLNARELIANRFGAVMARNNQVVLGVLRLEEQGKTFDNIDDAIRESKVSQAFIKSPIRTAFNSVAVTMPAGQRDQLQHVIDQRLEAGDEVGAQKELMSGIVKQMPAQMQREFFDRQEMLASLAEITQGLNALESQGIIIGPGEAIENKLREITRQEPKQAVARIIQRMRNIFVIFRQQMSGAAFSPEESAGYERIFPSPDKNLGMNRAILDSLTDTNLQNGRNSVVTIAPSLLNAVTQPQLDRFLTGSVNPPGVITGESAFLSQDQRDNIIAEARAQLTAGKTAEEIASLLGDLAIPENEINEILQSIGAR